MNEMEEVGQANEEIIESDFELEGGIVEPDNGPPQKVFCLGHYVSYC